MRGRAGVRWCEGRGRGERDARGRHAEVSASDPGAMCAYSLGMASADVSEGLSEALPTLGLIGNGVRSGAESRPVSARGRSMQGRQHASDVISQFKLAYGERSAGGGQQTAAGVEFTPRAGHSRVKFTRA